MVRLEPVGLRNLSLVKVRCGEKISVMSLLQPQVCSRLWENQIGPQVSAVEAVPSWSIGVALSLSTWWTGAGAAVRDGLTWVVRPGE